MMTSPGSGAGASPLVSGYTPPLQRLEREIAPPDVSAQRAAFGKAASSDAVVLLERDVTPAECAHDDHPRFALVKHLLR